VSAPHAVIIAGGKGSRLGGVRKAELRIGGIGLLDRVAGRLAGVAEPILVATGPGTSPVRLPAGCSGIADLAKPCAGPLAGLVAAVQHLRDNGVRNGLLVSVAVDTPFLPTDFVSRMIASLGDSPAVYAAWGEDFFPPHAVWQLEALQGLPIELDSGAAPNSLKALQRRIGARRLDWAQRGKSNPFININTMAELLTAQARVPG
jgi:molybdenum cofactor guanylyltransferase